MEMTAADGRLMTTALPLTMIDLYLCGCSVAELGVALSRERAIGGLAVRARIVHLVVCTC
jgi:hypothetical protein